MRLFVAVPLPSTVRDGISGALNPGRSWPGIRWIDASAFHVTLKFLGETRDEQIPSISAALRHAGRSIRPFSLGVKGGGAFPTPRRPRIFWVGLVGGTASLSALAARVEELVSPLGFPTEERAFHPHITVGRSRDGLKPGFGERFGTLLAPFSAPEFDVTEIHLMRSHLSPASARYETLEIFPLSE